MHVKSSLEKRGDPVCFQISCSASVSCIQQRHRAAAQPILLALKKKKKKEKKGAGVKSPKLGSAPSGNLHTFSSGFRNRLIVLPPILA